MQVETSKSRSDYGSLGWTYEGSIRVGRNWRAWDKGYSRHIRFRINDSQ